MMNFPDTPTSGQSYGTYTWDGEKWVSTGSLGGVPEAPADHKIYGRKDLTWQEVISDVTKAYVDAQVAARVAKAGDVMTGGLTLTTLTSTAGINLGANAVAAANDVTRHLALYGTSYGFSITGGTLNIVSNNVAQMQLQSGNVAVTGGMTTTGSMTVSGNFATNAISCGGITCTPINTQGNRIDCGPLSASGRIDTANSAGTMSQSGTGNSIQVLSNAAAGESSFITFHRQGSWASHFGIDTDNQWKVGGWSMGGPYRIWHEANFAPGNYVNKGGDTMSGSLTVNGNIATNSLSCSHLSTYDIYTNGYGITCWGYTSYGSSTVQGSLWVHNGGDYGLLYFGNGGGRYIESPGNAFNFQGGNISCSGEISAASNMHCWISYAEAISCVEWCNVGTLNCGGQAHANWISTDGGVNCAGELATGSGDYGVQRLGNPGSGRYWVQSGGKLELAGIDDLRFYAAIYGNQSAYLEGSISVQGTGYKNGGGMWNDFSDVRIKNVLGNYQAGLDEVLSLQPVRFTFKGNDTTEPPSNLLTAPYRNSRHYPAAANGTEFVGLIAQDCERTMPELVKMSDGCIDGAAVTDLREVDTSPLIYAMINAVKTLAARIEKLETKH